jgi:putative FmdB family regulatory protein|tara:strand:+ start:1364 stop:1738 length:375 start_codon:yes stop_codon:yes gene_type:complete
MPIYEYRCEKCDHELETIQKVSESPLTTCPECGDQTLKKRISAAGFRLKGGGWYETDFKSGKKKNVAGSEGSSGSSSDDNDSSSSSSDSSSGDSGSSKSSSDSDGGSSDSGGGSSDSGSKAASP